LASTIDDGSTKYKATIQLLRGRRKKPTFWRVEADMRNTLKSMLTGALCSGLAVTALAGSAWAGPMNATHSRGIEAPSLADQVYYRRYYRGGYYRRGYDPGAAAAAAAAVGVLGAAAAAGAYAQPYYGYPAYGYYGYPYGYGW
jgi:hypothetical protein